MSRRQPIQHEWETPGYTFSLQPPWPPGFEPQLVLRTAEQTAAWDTAMQAVRERKAAGLGWGRGTLDMTGTPDTPAPAEVATTAAAAAKAKRDPHAARTVKPDEWCVRPDSVVWQTVSALRACRGHSLPLDTVADLLDRPRQLARANLQRALRQQVVQIDSTVFPIAIKLGPRAGIVRMRTGVAA